MPTSLPILKEKDQSGEERGSADKKMSISRRISPSLEDVLRQLLYIELVSFAYIF